METEGESFYNSTEIQTNKLISKAMLFIIPVFPLLYLGNVIGFFPELNNILVLIISCAYSLFAVLNYFANKYQPFKKSTKFILVFIIGILIFFLSLCQGLNFYITYVFLILLSTFYFDKNFTRITVIYSVIIMVSSFYIRSLTMIELNYRTTRQAWFIAYTSGSLVEFAFYSIFAVYLAVTIKNVLDVIFTNKKSINATNTQLDESFARLESELMVLSEKYGTRNALGEQSAENSVFKTTYFDNYNDNFYKDYEKNQNMLVLKMTVWLWFTLPFLIAGKLAGIFPAIEYPFLLLLATVYSAGIGIAIAVLKKNPESKAIKYILLYTIEVAMLLMSVNQGLELFISYALVPFISCLYLNKKFSLHLLISCFVLMILSLGGRAAFNVPNYVYIPADKVHSTPLQWFFGYSLGLTCEYIVNAVPLYALISRNQKIVHSVYDGTKELFKAQTTMISRYVEAISLYNTRLEQHSRNVAAYVSIICKNLRLNHEYSEELTDEQIFRYTSAALLHDIGIIAIPNTMVFPVEKKDEITDDMINQHVYEGTQLLKDTMISLDKDFLTIMCNATLFHHENWDGTGYPRRLKGKEIPLVAQIIAGANLIDNLLSGSRDFEKVSFDEVIPIVKSYKGTKIAPDIARAIQNAEMELWKYYDSIM